jgi:hypothetical protein
LYEYHRYYKVVAFILNILMISKIISNTLKGQSLALSIRRYFNLHEYQSKDLMRKYGVLVQRGSTATTPDDAFKVAKGLNVQGGDYILKAQVQAGGRGKGKSLSQFRSPN